MSNYIGLQDPAVASESSTNWSNADLAVNHINATQFGIGVYSLTDTDMTGNGSITINFASPLPLGGFAVAYGCSGTDSTGASPQVETSSARPRQAPIQPLNSWCRRPVTAGSARRCRTPVLPVSAARIVGADSPA